MKGCYIVTGDQKSSQFLLWDWLNRIHFYILNKILKHYAFKMNKILFVVFVSLMMGVFRSTVAGNMVL